MPRANTALLALPHSDYMEYAACVAREVARAHARPYTTIRILEGGDANPDRIDEALSSLDPALFLGVGHGGEDVWTCENREEYMRACTPRASGMAGRIVVLVSCLTARRLGPDLVEKGALAYLGSRDELWFYIGEPPCASRASKAVFLCEMQALASLLDGRTAAEAHGDRLRRYAEEALLWAVSPHPDAPVILWCLLTDRAVAVQLGRGDARAVEPAAPQVPWHLAAIGLAPLILVTAAAALGSKAYSPAAAT